MWKNIIQKSSINTLLLGIYLFVVWSIYLFVNFYDGISNMISFLGLLLLCAIMVFFISRAIMSLISKIPSAQSTEFTRKKKIMSYCVFFLVSFGILFFWYMAYYPGAFSSDSLGQYTQAITGNYDDWHPVWHTLLFFTLPLTITGKAASIIFFQIIYFSLVLGYLALCAYQFFNVKAAVIALAYILLNPCTGCIAMYPWKDAAMAITVLWSMVCVAKIYFTKGQWGEQKGRVLLAAFVLANATLFRHNAILFTLPMVLALFFQLNRKKWVGLALLFFAFIFIVKVPMYSAMHVGKPGYRKVETLGLPLTVIGNVTKEYPQVLDEETSAFVHRLAAQEVWEEYYICGCFGSIKGKIDKNVIEETNPLDILSMMLRCFKAAPQSSCKAFFMLTDMVYAIEGPIEGDFSPGIEVNELGIAYKGIETFKVFLQWYKQTVTATVFKYIRYIGISILIMAAFILNRSDLRKWNDWKRILLCVPIFIYDFGTMLLLMSADARFFYASFLACPAVVLIMLKSGEEKLL